MRIVRRKLDDAFDVIIEYTRTAGVTAVTVEALTEKPITSSVLNRVPLKKLMAEIEPASSTVEFWSCKPAKA